MIASRLILAFALAVVMPGAAFAGDSDEVVVSASRSAGLPSQAKTDKTDTTPGTIAQKPASQEQVMAYLANAPQVDRPMADNDLQPAPGAATGGRTVHGSAGVSIGTGGYRSAYVSALFPVGENGTLGIAISQTDFGENGGFGYGGYGYGYGDYGYGGYNYGGYGGRGHDGYGYGRGHRGTSKSLAVSFTSDDDDLNGADTPEGCAPGFRAGGRYVEPVWVSQLHGNRSCETDFLP